MGECYFSCTRLHRAETPGPVDEASPSSFKGNFLYATTMKGISIPLLMSRFMIF